MTDLSPSAQAVLAAYRNRWDFDLAAALEALVDVVVPVEISLRRGMRPGGTGSITPDEFKQDQRSETRRKILAIAAELRGEPTTTTTTPKTPMTNQNTMPSIVQAIKDSVPAGLAPGWHTATVTFKLDEQGNLTLVDEYKISSLGNDKP